MDIEPFVFRYWTRPGWTAKKGFPLGTSKIMRRSPWKLHYESNAGSKDERRGHSKNMLIESPLPHNPKLGPKLNRFFMEIHLLFGLKYFYCRRKLLLWGQRQWDFFARRNRKYSSLLLCATLSTNYTTVWSMNPLYNNYVTHNNRQFPQLS